MMENAEAERRWRAAFHLNTASEIAEKELEIHE